MTNIVYVQSCPCDKCTVCQDILLVEEICQDTEDHKHKDTTCVYCCGYEFT